MTARIINGIDELKALAGEHLGYSDYLEITQDRVNQFAEATGDHQWIHVDPERAKSGPFGGTIAHGFLTLSMLPKLSESTFEFADRKMGVNYGLNKVRFPAPLPVRSRVRGRCTLLGVDTVEGGVQATWSILVERDGSVKPCCAAEWLVRYYQ